VGDGAAEMGGDEDIRELNSDEEGNGWTTDDGSSGSTSKAAEGESDSDASSELGNLAKLQAAVEEDDEDSDSEDEPFKGNDSYDDMDWFVQHMEVRPSVMLPVLQRRRLMRRRLMRRRKRSVGPQPN